MSQSSEEKKVGYMVFPVIIPYTYYACIHGNFTLFQQKYKEFNKEAKIINSEATFQIKL